MKTTIQMLLTGLFVAACLQILPAQNRVSYGYDAAGNRISRTIVMKLRSAPAPQEEEEPPVYSEMLSEIRLNIYPNPTDGLLHVEILNLPDKQTADIMLYNLSC